MNTKPFNRREFLKWSAVAGASLGAAPWTARAGETPPKDKPRPNILFICTDQQRVDDMSCARNPYVKTPAIDSLAGRGVRFTRSYCAFPLCSPSRATHVTSRMAHEVGINNNSHPLPADVPSLGTLFKEAGYRTAFTGKWHLPSTWPPPDSNQVPGFEILPREGNPEPSGKAKKGKKGPQPAAGKADKASKTGGPGSQNDPFSLDAALRFLKEKPQQPFLLFVSYLNPHDICGFHETSPQTLNLPTDPASLPPAPANVDAPDLGPAKGSGRASTTSKKQNSGLNWPELVWRQQLYHYYDLTTEVDALVGKVLDALREAGLEQNTVILFTSDHGEMAGAHHRVRKMSLYEEAMKVPFILAGPGVPRGATDDSHLVSGLDVLPTLCDFAGIASPPQARGFSVKPLLDNPKAPWREAVFAALGERGGRMVRTARHKYNVYAGNKEELFDLQADPGETKNLAGDPAMAPVLAEHRKLLHDWMEKTADPFAHPEAQTASRPARQGGGEKAAKAKTRGKAADKKEQSGAKRSKAS